MTKSKKNTVMYIVTAVVLVALFIIFALTNGGNGAQNTFWSLVPPIVAIALALVTKEVYSSLFIGIATGALLYCNLNVVQAFITIFQGVPDETGTMVGGMIPKVANSGNIGIIIFLVVLGILVVLMNKAGGSAAYGQWASNRIKNRKGALLSTFGLGALIFVDDYFNCLTVGSVMRPITDKHQVSRAKLAYIIDATAAPVCIIAPISSWAAAVTGVVEGANGLELFIKSIPYNLYAILTIVMVVAICAMDIDFGAMKKHEENAKKGDLYTTDARPYADVADIKPSSKGKVIDLVLPVVVLIISCIIGMVYTGGFFTSGAENYMDFVSAFSACNASLGLVLGSVAALIITFLIYIPRKVLTFDEFMSCFPEGFKSMVPAILILVFAWTLSGMTNILGADVYVAGIVDMTAGALNNFLPAILFLIAMGLAFATGTSWGTFGILLPIVVPILPANSEILIIAISSCLAGAVCGDHCSPISDTTIMASTGAQSDHVNHVSTQLPYALFVAAFAFLGFILAGFVQSAWVVLPVCIVLMLAALIVIKRVSLKKAN